MKLLILYGPPGVGKLTVAKELAKLTGFKIFHNHLTLDLVKSLFGGGRPRFRKLLADLRLDLLELAAKWKVPGVIFTIVYEAEADDAFFRQIVRRVTKHRAQVHFVQLITDRKTIEKRIVRADRRRFQKINHVASIRSLMRKFNMFKMAPFPNTISIDNTELSSKTAAKIIQKHWKL